MRSIVIVNAGAGSLHANQSDAETARIRRAMEAAGIDTLVRATPPDQMESTAREAARDRPDAVVAAGGDGTISAVASALVGGDVPLGVLAAGTRNHFARDLNLPLEFEPA